MRFFKKENFAKLREVWRKIRQNWKMKYRLIIRNESENHESFSLRLSPRNIFVVVTTSAVVLIVLTAMLIAFTPLRVYVPGYTSPDEFRKYREAARRVDSVELLLAQNQQYVKNFYRILNDEVMPNEMPEGETAGAPASGDALAAAAEHSQSELDLRDEADDLIRTIALRDEVNAEQTVNQRANIRNLFLQPPTAGTIVGYFSVPQSRYGIDVTNRAGTLVTSAGTGMVVFAGYEANAGNVIIVQHAGNVLSVYKHNRKLLKSRGDRVEVGEPIAEMGRTGIAPNGNCLRFELWHNGIPIDPLNYLTLK